MVGVKGPVTDAGNTTLPTLPFTRSRTTATIVLPSGTGVNWMSVRVVLGRVMLLVNRNVWFMAASTMLKLTEQPVLVAPTAKVQVTVPM